MTDMLAGRLNVKTREFAMKRVPAPEPGHGQVRIEVAAAGVPLGRPPHRRHAEPGSEPAGVEELVKLTDQAAWT